MKALLLADRLGTALLPLTNRTAPALLPVLAKPLAIHTIEALVTAGIRDLVVATSPFSEELKRTLGSGERWGVTIEYVLTRGGENPGDVLSRLGGRLLAPFLVLRGDILINPFLGAFLEKAQHVPGDLVTAIAGGAFTGVTLVRKTEVACTLPVSPEESATWKAPKTSLEIEGAAYSGCETLLAYHQANMDALNGKFEGLIPAGQQVAVGVTLGRRSKFPLRTVRAWPVFAGSRCEVHPEAELAGNVVLSDSVIVDRGATVKNSVVLPNSYVGELVEIENAIVWTNDLIRVDTGAVAKVTDRFLLADLEEAPVGEAFENTFHRLCGFVLLLLSLPVWPVALLLSLFSGRGVFLKRQILGNRKHRDEMGQLLPKPVWLVEFSTSIPWMRRIPWLFFTVSGDMRLSGVSPMTPEESENRTEEWEMVRDQAYTGLFGPAQLSLPEDAPWEERILADASYARTRSFKSDLSWLGRGLLGFFSARAWRSP